MHDPLAFERRAVPARIADLGFSVELPRDWIAHDLPEADDDFSDPSFFLPLCVVSAPHAAIVFAVGARPAYDDGTLDDWARYHLGNGQMQPLAVGLGLLGPLPAIVGEAMQDSEIGGMVVRFAFCEDGQRLLNLSLTAPVQLAGAVAPVWERAVRSFMLDAPRGTTVALAPGMPEPSASNDTPSDAPENAPGDAPDDAQDAPSAAAAAPATFAQFALADTGDTLDPDHPINVNLRDGGVGLTPRVIATDDDARRAKVAAGAVLATFDVPYGWHVIDDGRRTLVFDASGAVQINLDLLARAGQSDDDLLGAIAAQIRADYPSSELLRLSADGVEALGVRNIVVDGEPLEQVHMLVAGRDDDTVLRARVTSTPDTITDACNLAELVLRSVSFEPDGHGGDAPATHDAGPQAPPADGQPAWWHRAQALERADRLSEAEEAITSAVQHLGAYASIAHLYAARTDRLLRAGDRDGAAAAYGKARQWMYSYAAAATSGGEGVALSMERDEFLAELASAYPELAR